MSGGASETGSARPVLGRRRESADPEKHTDLATRLTEGPLRLLTPRAAPLSSDSTPTRDGADGGAQITPELLFRRRAASVFIYTRHGGNRAAHMGARRGNAPEVMAVMGEKNAGAQMVSVRRPRRTPPGDHVHGDGRF